MTERTETTPCPTWCAGNHPTGPGAVHRVEIGHAEVGGKRLTVVVLQAPDGVPSMVVAGHVYVEIAPDDHDDAATLFTLTGQPELAGLIRQAAKTLQETTR